MDNCRIVTIKKDETVDIQNNQTIKVKQDHTFTITDGNRIERLVGIRWSFFGQPSDTKNLLLTGPNMPGEGVPVACYPPEADFLVRSRQRPEQVVRSAAEFQRLRREHQAQPVTDRWGRWWKQVSEPA